MVEILNKLIVDQINDSVNIHVNKEISLELTVHEIRKSVKRIRALLHFLIPAFDQLYFLELNRKLGTTGKKLTLQREATVNLQTFIGLTEQVKERMTDTLKDKCISYLSNNVNNCYYDNKEHLHEVLNQVSVSIVSLNSQIILIDGSEIAPQALIQNLCISFQKAKQLFNDAQSTLKTETIHKWRKYAKNLLYQLKYGPFIKTNELDQFINDLDLTTDLQGKDHDMAVMEYAVIKNAGLSTKEAETICSLVNFERIRIQQETFTLGGKVFSAPGFDPIFKNISIALFSQEIL